MNHRAKASHIRNNTSKKLLINLRIFAVVYLGLLAFSVYSVVNSHIVWWQVLVAALIGLTVGLISARMYKISWDSDKAEVIGKIDIYGGIVLALFIVFELNRNFVADLFAPREAVGVLGFVILTAALFGRIIGTSKYILRVLKKQGFHF